MAVNARRDVIVKRIKRRRRREEEWRVRLKERSIFLNSSNYVLYIIYYILYTIIETAQEQ